MVDSFESITEWLLEHYAYGHLDEMPDWVLTEFIMNKEISLPLSEVILTAGMTKSDSPEELLAVNEKLPMNVMLLLEAHVRIRAWLILERLRRLDRLKINRDVLIKELASKSIEGMVSNMDGTPYKNQIVEVLPGVVNIIGQELDICKE